MSKSTILLQLDADDQPSVFDAVVAVDSGVEQLFRHGGVTPQNVRELVHGAMFTRGPAELNRTAIFVGGSNVAVGEEILAGVQACFFGPMRVSVMLDANGANTTAAAAVLAAMRHVDLANSLVTVLGGTGPVGQRAALLAAREGAEVRVASRSRDRAALACERIQSHQPDARLSAVEVSDEQTASSAVAGAQVLIAAGAAGVELANESVWTRQPGLLVAIDLNAVPPAGIAGVEVTAGGDAREGTNCYGAIGVGGFKMKIHKAAVRRLFERNDAVLDAVEIFELGRELENAS